MLTTIVTILSSICGSGFIIYILQRLIINSMSEQQRQHNRLILEEVKSQYAKSLEEVKSQYVKNLEEMKTNHQREIENYKINLNNYKRYSDEQFKLYNEFWVSLCDLKNSAEKLWINASKDNLLPFAKQLKETKEMLEKSVLLIEDSHYETLMRLIDTFSRFSFGKESLIQLAERRAETRNIQRYQLDELVDSNREIKEEYDAVLLELSKVFKNHIYYSNPNVEDNKVM
ncbi:hypothetical protein [Bacillus cereus]|uniref:hypothetical protein n=1 Tax=Bacillus cereus TaxID=1396 RepID=UPI00032FBF57|nr:hypothetical protein [Bacillus cereus]EOP01808.1 hypothetical protein II1_04801 [Bacillus cereus MC118]